MALKPDRKILGMEDASYFMDQVAVRGGIVTASTYGSGAALDNSVHLCSYAANPSGLQPLGVLAHDCVDVDLTLYKLNQHKSEFQKGGKAPIYNKGWFLTDYTWGTITPGPAYVGPSGRVQATITNNIANTPLVGRFIGRPDEDGFVKLEVNLP